MNTIIDVAERIKNLALHIEKEVSVIIDNTKEQILIKNKQQLMEGIKGDGNEITPSYLNDPYFKTREAAQRYSNWKDKITPNSKRKSGTPNLYINGFYHNTIEINVKGEKIITENKTTIGKKIEQKYGDTLYGLNETNNQAYIKETFFPALKVYIEETTQLQMK